VAGDEAAATETGEPEAARQAEAGGPEAARPAEPGEPAAAGGEAGERRGGGEPA